jgi:nicotinic acid phosphoribosyltransferase
MNVALTKPAGGLALLTDLYQLTMAYGYWKTGKADQEAVFHLFFRSNPFRGGLTLTAGLADAVAYLCGFRFEESDLDYLASLQGRDGKPLLSPAFLDCLRKLRFTCDVEAVAEGTVMFPHEPLLRVRGPILQAQLVETALLNIINFQSLIATQAARVCHAAQGDPVVEFGLRRAPRAWTERSRRAGPLTSADAPEVRTCWPGNYLESRSKALLSAIDIYTTDNSRRQRQKNENFLPSQAISPRIQPLANRKYYQMPQTFGRNAQL